MKKKVFRERYYGEENLTEDSKKNKKNTTKKKGKRNAKSSK